MSDFWRDRPVLVTGATGLLGSWMVDGLLGLMLRTQTSANANPQAKST